jgi:hypothetical protein
MFGKYFRSFKERPVGVNAARPAIEVLESRRLLSASSHAALAQDALAGNTIEFSQAPAAVQTGLDTLATKDGVTAPTSTQTVFLSNINGIERYSVDIASTGTDTVLTVNQNGKAITAPTRSTTTFGALSGIASAATGEITAIATALSLTAPTSATTIHVLTTSDGAVTYSLHLGSSSSGRGATITVDANGNPIGNQSLPFSVIPATIQAALNTNAPTGAVALGAASTQIVKVRTLNGVITYSTPFTVNGTTTTITVNASDAVAALPSTTSTTFSAIPTAAQTELQTLATADGFSGTIDPTLAVSAYDEANGTTVYTITVPASQSGSGQTITVNITLSVDQSGNPTTLPVNGRNHRGFGCDGDAGTTSGSSSTGTSTASGNTFNGFGRFGRGR